MSEEIREIVEVLEEFSKSHAELLGKWPNSGLLDNLDAIDNYPFHKNFEEIELDVNSWVKETIAELKKLSI